jgi:hypothetical protein
MDVTITVPTQLEILVTGVKHPEHAVNRLKKYLKENSFTVDRTGYRAYTPDTPIVIEFDEMELARNLDLTAVVDPPVWFDKGEIKDVVKALELFVGDETAAKVGRFLEENSNV